MLDYLDVPPHNRDSNSVSCVCEKEREGIDMWLVQKWRSPSELSGLRRWQGGKVACWKAGQAGRLGRLAGWAGWQADKLARLFTPPPTLSIGGREGLETVSIIKRQQLRPGNCVHNYEATVEAWKLCPQLRGNSPGLETVSTIKRQ